MNALQIEKIRPWLSPLSTAYGVGVRLRNYLFDRALLKSESFATPIICVGNLSVGGTGKTPHVEFIISQLQNSYRIAVLSRGYKRKSRGLVHATIDSTALDIGDEARQIKQKHPDITVVVDANRRRAIRYLEALPEKDRPELIILDDGFQHRYVKPCMSIVIEDYQRLHSPKKLLPAGDLREPISARKRSDCVIISKCPIDLTPINYRIIERGLELYPHQRLYFSQMCYAPMRSIFGNELNEGEEIEVDRVLAVAGIANPQQFYKELQRRYGKTQVELISFPDHHRFSDSDLKTIANKWQSIGSKDEKRLFISTEKDAMRLQLCKGALPQDLVEAAYYLPICPRFAFNGAGAFVAQIQEAIVKHQSFAEYKHL